MVALTPTTYMNGVSGNKAFVGESSSATIYGAGFKNVKNVKLNGLPVKIIKAADDAVEFEVPGSLAAGIYSIALTGEGLNFTYQDGLQVGAKPVLVKSSVKTITCVKGKSSKRITGSSPKCPVGYKQK